MKLLFLSIFILGTLEGKPQTNIYHPFPDSNAVWTQNYGYSEVLCCPMLVICESDNFSYQIKGDTLIGGVTYHKIYIPYIDSHTDTRCGGGALLSAGYKGAFRQDTILKKVFFVQPNHTGEGLLYNFNLNIGDTMFLDSSGVCHPATDNELVIDSIDSIAIQSSYRKTLICHLISSSFPFSIIEGIGSSKGFLELGCTAIDNYGWSLDCF